MDLLSRAASVAMTAARAAATTATAAMAEMANMPEGESTPEGNDLKLTLVKTYRCLGNIVRHC